MRRRTRQGIATSTPDRTTEQYNQVTLLLIRIYISNFTLGILITQVLFWLEFYESPVMSALQFEDFPFFSIWLLISPNFTFMFATTLETVGARKKSLRGQNTVRKLLSTNSLVFCSTPPSKFLDK